MTEAEVQDLVVLCGKYELEGREILAEYTVGELTRIFNGIGPASFPSWTRRTLDALHPSLLPAALIHDVENERADGKLSTFTESNARLRRNGMKAAKCAYKWYDPRRYAAMFSAARYASICQNFGWEFWVIQHDINNLRKKI